MCILFIAARAAAEAAGGQAETGGGEFGPHVQARNERQESAACSAHSGRDAHAGSYETFRY
jgi:hypothetical protein